MLKKIITYIGLCFLFYAIVCFITPYNNYLLDRSINNQINYLSQILDEGYDDRMQARFPEGKLFSNALLALSTIDYCERTQISEKKYSLIVDKSIARFLSKQSLEVFDNTLQPETELSTKAGQIWSILNISKVTYSSIPKFKN